MTDRPADQQDPQQQVQALVKAAAAQIASGKATLADVFAAIHGVNRDNEVAAVGQRTPPPVPALTEDQITAIKRLPEVYGQVTPTTDRALNKTEAQRIVEERKTIDEVLTVLKKRKEESIRETLANHLDHLLIASTTEEERDLYGTDAKGHFQIKQEVPVEGTDQKIQKTISDPKPHLSMAKVQEAHEAGLIDRPTYLAITKKPEVPRVLDEERLVKAIKKDPGLLLLLAQFTETPSKTTTIKVVKNT